MKRSTFLYGAHAAANGIRQHYLRYGGRGEPLLILPGITSPAITWGFVGERLGQFFDTYILDLRGRGLSEGGPQLCYGLDDYAPDVAAFSAALNLGRCRVLAHSMGGRIAARLGHRFPETVARLVIVDPPLSGPGHKPFSRLLEYYSAPLARARQGLLTFDEVRSAFPAWSEENVRLRVEWLHTCDETAVAQSVRGFHNEEVHHDFAALTMPTLLVVAGKGGLITEADVEELKRLQPRLAVTTIAHTGHMIPFEDLQAFLDAVQAFLSSN